MEWLQFLLLVLATIGYSLPWVASTSASLQPGALDLAEWLTLHPAVRSNMPLLLPALLLRLALVFLGLIFVLEYKAAPTHRLRWLHAVFALGMWLALVPPIAFFAGEFGDRNYQQQFTLWIAYTLTSLASIIWLDGIDTRIPLVILAVLGGGISVVGTLWGYTLLARYDIPLHIGVGSALYTITLVIFGIQQWRQYKPGKDHASPSSLSKSKTAY